MSNEQEKYQPYREDQREGSNNLTANEGSGSTKPAEHNGWPWDDKTGNKGENQ